MGEQALVQFERERLCGLARPDLAERVDQVSKSKGDGLGYDVLSFDEHGGERHIEVKTTKAGASTPFYISENELAYAALHSALFVLARVYNFDSTTGSGEVYELEGDIRTQLALEPTQYRARL